MAIALASRQRREEEGESVFVSMTDLTVSFLFIILVLLAFFATQFKPEEMVSRAEYQRLEAEIERLEWLLAERENEIERLEWLLAERGGEIERLRDTQAMLRREITATEERERSLRRAIERLERLLAERDREIARLLERIAELEKPDPLAVYLERIAATRVALLERIAEQLRQQLPGIRVTVVATDGVIRFRGDDLFRPGQWRIHEGSNTDRVAHAIGDALIDTLPCYTVGVESAFDNECNGAFAAIETIQIEGHTDNIPLSERLREREQMLDNRDLSARRGVETLRAMADRYRPALMEFLNLRGQPVLSFAGYGAMRPIEADNTPEAYAANRRIDIRFILQTPQNVPEIEEIRAQLTRNRPHLPPIVAEENP